MSDECNRSQNKLNTDHRSGNTEARNVRRTHAEPDDKESFVMLGSISREFLQQQQLFVLQRGRVCDYSGEADAMTLSTVWTEYCSATLTM